MARPLFPQLPNSIIFGSLSSLILPTCPSHCNLLSIMKSGIDQLIPNLPDRVLDVNLSFHCWNLVTPRIVLTQWLWKEVKRLTCSAFSIQVSAPYNSTASTVALYTALLVGMERMGLPNTAPLNPLTVKRAYMRSSHIPVKALVFLGTGTRTLFHLLIFKFYIK